MQVPSWKKGQANRNAIINTVKTIGECYPHEITDFIDNTIRQKYRRLGFLKENEIESWVEHERVKERTLFDWLKILRKEGILNRSNNRYSLTDKVKSDDRYFPDLVGDSIVSQLMLLHRPTLYPFEHNVKQLVESFGFYLLWSLSALFSFSFRLPPFL